MAFPKILTNFLFQRFQQNVVCNPEYVRQIRHLYVDRRIIKDNEKRQFTKLYGKERFRLNLLRKNYILPPELQEMAHDELKAFPRKSCPTQLRHRCAVTARNRGNVRIFRLSRIIFRHLADYNLLSGVQRSTW